MPEPLYYVNGQYVRDAASLIEINDLGFIRGYGVFDVLRTYNHKPFKLVEHLQRLFRSAQAIDMLLPWSQHELEQRVYECYERSSIADATIRLVVTGGAAADYLTPAEEPTLVIIVDQVPRYPEENYTHGVKAISFAIERFLPAVKSTSYISAVMGLKKARAAQAKEAIYVSAKGELFEGTTTNIFAVKDNVLITPKDNILIGITRNVVLELAQAQLPIQERSIGLSELATIQECFITSTTKEIMPIIQIDDQLIGTGQPGPATQRMQRAFQAYIASQ